MELCNISSQRFICQNCKHEFVKYFFDMKTYKLHINNTFICDNCNHVNFTKLFVLTHNNKCYDIYYSNNTQSFFITDEKFIIIATYVKNKYKLADGFTMQKLSVPHLFSLERIIRELPWKLQKWYYTHGGEIYYFNGFKYEFTTDKIPFVNTIISNIGGITVEHKNIVGKKIIESNKKYTLEWIYKDEAVTKRTARNLLEINTTRQDILYDGKVIAHYGKIKRKKIIISWLNEVNVAELNVDLNDIIKAMRKSHPKYEVNFYNETELV